MSEFFFCHRCGRRIDLDMDWNQLTQQIGDCPNCRHQIAQKIIKKENQQWHQKPCVDCGKIINYNLTWKKIPNYCRTCAQKRGLTQQI